MVGSWAIFATVLLLVDSQSLPDFAEFSENLQKFGDNCECSFGSNNCDCTCKNPDESGSDLPPLPCNVTHCPNFSFELDGGAFDHLPSKFFSVLTEVDTFYLDMVGVDFVDFLPNYPNPSPFNEVSFKSEAYLVLLKVNVSNRWNWSALQDIKPSGRTAKASVQIMRSPIPVLTKDFCKAFNGSVTSIRISRCHLKILEDAVFVGFSNITDVNLSKNEILELERSFFPKPALKLENIILSTNKISHLPDDMFWNMPALKAVDLTSNPITTLDEKTFAPYINLVKFVGLNEFHLMCDCRIQWLKNWNSSLNPMDQATCDAPTQLKGLKILDLHESNFQC